MWKGLPAPRKTPQGLRRGGAHDMAMTAVVRDWAGVLKPGPDPDPDHREDRAADRLADREVRPRAGPPRFRHRGRRRCVLWLAPCAGAGSGAAPRRAAPRARPSRRPPACRPRRLARRLRPPASPRVRLPPGIPQQPTLVMAGVAMASCRLPCRSCRRSSGVEHTLGKGGVECSIHSGGTISLQRPALDHGARFRPTGPPDARLGGTVPDQDRPAGERLHQPPDALTSQFSARTVVLAEPLPDGQRRRRSQRSHLALDAARSRDSDSRAVARSIMEVLRQGLRQTPASRQQGPDEANNRRRTNDWRRRAARRWR